MKPCSQLKERVALFAVSASPGDEDAVLREHLEHCAGCRAYCETVRGIGLQHAAQAREMPELDPSPGFHARLVRRMSDRESPHHRRFRLSRAFDGLAIPIPAAACVLALALGLVWWQATRPSPNTRQAAETHANVEPSSAASPLPPAPPPPSLARYREVMNRSVDELEALLTREGLRASPGSPSTHSLRDRNFELLILSDAAPPGTSVP